MLVVPGDLAVMAATVAPVAPFVLLLPVMPGVAVEPMDPIVRAAPTEVPTAAATFTVPVAIMELYVLAAPGTPLVTATILSSSACIGVLVCIHSLLIYSTRQDQNADSKRN